MGHDLGKQYDLAKTLWKNIKQYKKNYSKNMDSHNN